MLENVLQGHPFLKGDIVQIVHSFQDCSGCVIGLVCVHRCTLLCSPTPHHRARMLQGEGKGGNKIVFTFYCMSPGAWLTAFVSPGSEAPEQGWVQSTGEIADWRLGGLCRHCVLINLFYPGMFPFTLLRKWLAFYQESNTEIYSSCLQNKRSQSLKAWGWQLDRCFPPLK